MVSDPLIGQTIGNYEIVHRLGKGGMATVYRARQVNMQRDVAIKIMSEDLTEDPRFVARFEQEARVIANLQHPRILPVHDFGHENNIFYLVMRLIEGESLYHRMLHGPLPFLTASKYLTQIAEALDYAHSQSIIHRDLKPNNVLIDEWDNIYLMDFGLAKLIAASQQLTQTGAVLGTPAYMAPEQWRGEPVDARTDVYSLGVILYEMILGHPPFESDTPFTLMYKHLNDTPPLPSGVESDLPDELEAIMLKALAKDKTGRFASAGDLAHEFATVARVAGSLVIRERLGDTVGEPAGHEAGHADDAGEIAAQHPAVAPMAEVLDIGEPEAAGEVATPEPESAVASEEGSTPDAAANAPASRDAFDDVPLPDKIAPPPPPIPLPHQSSRVPSAYASYRTPPNSAEGEAGSGVRDLVSRVTAHPQVQRALEVVDHGVESAVEKAAQAAPPLKGSDSSGEVFGHAPTSAAPVNAPAFQTLRGMVPADDPLVGVVDVRGTHQWHIWKNLLVAGITLFFFGGITGAGFFSFLGILMLGYLGFESFRTWRGDIGRYYLGFTARRVVVVPRFASGEPQLDRVWVVGWPHVERLRLTDRYVLLDLTAETGESLHFGALVMAEAEGGLGQQTAWLPGSPVAGLIAERGFETRNL